jgi:hypothetical protein
VLRIKSGDTVEIQTLVTSSPERFENAGMSPDRIEQPLRDISGRSRRRDQVYIS